MGIILNSKSKSTIEKRLKVITKTLKVNKEAWDRADMGRLLKEGDMETIRHDPEVIEVYLGRRKDETA